jgi:hypothetical protein
MKSWIYFARCGEQGPIKIGHADDPHRRVADLNVGSPVQLFLLCAMLSDRAVEEEDELHDRLCAHRVRGEWFEAGPVLEEMKRLESRLVAAEQVHAYSLECSWAKIANLHIRVTPEEIKSWRAAADEQHKSLSAWIRDMCNPVAELLVEDETV